MFIALDGIDGCGKSTVGKIICDTLNERGVKCILTKPLGGDATSLKMRNILLDTDNILDADAIPFLFISDMLHVAKSIIIPELASGSVVVTDRYIPSTWVYQIETAEHLSLKQKTILESVLHTWIPKPDKTFILDVTEAEACNRLEMRNKTAGLEYGKKDRYEYVDPVEISRRRVAYLTFANSEFGKRYNVEYRSTSDPGTTPEQVAASIIATLKNKFN